MKDGKADIDSLEVIAFNPYTHGYYYPIAFMLLTGVRIGELMGLKWQDVDFKNSTISIERTMEFNVFLMADGMPPKSLQILLDHSSV